MQMRNAAHAGLYLAWAYFSYLMLLITLQYVPLNLDVAFLRVKQEEIALPHYQWAFFIHVYTSIFVLLLGILQFSPYLRKRYPHVHRKVGKGYVLLILAFAGPSGLVMGYYANGGLWGQISFCLLSALWLYTTGMAWWHAKKGNWRQHKHFMYRSYALTLSAISLRLFKWVIVALFAPPPMDTYRLVAWLGWVANLAIAEFLIAQEKR